MHYAASYKSFGRDSQFSYILFALTHMFWIKKPNHNLQEIWNLKIDIDVHALQRKSRPCS